MKQNKSTKVKKEILYKVVTFLNRQELDFLDKIVKDVYFTSGNKIPRSQIVRQIIQNTISLNNFGKNLRDELAKTTEPGKVEHIENENITIKRREL